MDALLDWMEETTCVPGLVLCLETYLATAGEGSMMEIAKPFPMLTHWAAEHDTLGWDNFLEGRISGKLFHLQHEHLSNSGSRLHIQSWASNFMHHVLAITHHQWLFRNARIHIRLHEDKTMHEHQAIMDSVADMILVDSECLLPQHQHLLDQDFKKLGEGNTTDRQYWLANMSSAIQARQALAKSAPLTSPNLNSAASK
jgi:hypothetical protein